MDYFISRYISACDLLPARLRARAMEADVSLMASAEELRLRVGKPLSASVFSEENIFENTSVTAEDILETLTRAARGSLHSFADELSSGFITSSDGHRVGVCGRASMSGDKCITLREFSSLNLRIAKEVRGTATGIVDEICDGHIRSTLILSPPGGGKTTLLRDLIRIVSDQGFKVSVADERGEIAACSGGTPGFDMGRCTDVLTGAPKAWAALTMLRSMNPQVIALDEITDPADLDAILRAGGCGAAVFATMHADSLETAAARPGMETILPAFEKIVTIERITGERRVNVSDMPGKL